MAQYGRKIKEIDWDQVNRFIEAGSPGTEIADAIGVCAETLRAKTKEKFGIQWGEYSRVYDNKGKAALRLAQHDKAIKKQNVIMLIWLGKQRLNQYDRAALNITQNEINVEDLTLEELKMLHANPNLNLIGQKEIKQLEDTEILNDAEFTPEDCYSYRNQEAATGPDSESEICAQSSEFC